MILNLLAMAFNLVGMAPQANVVQSVRSAVLHLVDSV